MASKRSRLSDKAKPSRIYVPQEALPKRSLEDAVRVPTALHKTYAGKSATYADLCAAIGVGTESGWSKYLFGAAVAYGLTTKDDNEYALAETGRKIVAPTYD